MKLLKTLCRSSVDRHDDYGVLKPPGPPAITLKLRSSGLQILWTASVVFQRCGGGAAARTTDGGAATLVSELTRGPARGALLFAKSVFISTL